VTVGRHLGGAIEISLKVADFRNGSKPEVAALRRDVCFAPVSGHRQAVSACPKSAMCGRLRVGKSFLHVAGNIPQRRRTRGGGSLLFTTTVAPLAGNVSCLSHTRRLS
jgi:hypothetical protein